MCANPVSQEGCARCLARSPPCSRGGRHRPRLLHTGVQHELGPVLRALHDVHLLRHELRADDAKPRTRPLCPPRSQRHWESAGGVDCCVSTQVSSSLLPARIRAVCHNRFVTSSHILAPALFGFTLARTVETLPGAFFLVGCAALLVSLLLLMGIRLRREDTGKRAANSIGEHQESAQG